MSGIINEFTIFFKKHPVANSIVSFLFGGLLGGVLSNWGYQEFGYETVKVESLHLESPNKIESVYKVIDGIYKKNSANII